MKAASILVLLLIFAIDSFAQPRNDWSKRELKGRVKEVVQLEYWNVDDKEPNGKIIMSFNARGYLTEVKSWGDLRRCIGNCFSVAKFKYYADDKLKENKTYVEGDSILFRKHTFRYTADSTHVTYSDPIEGTIDSEAYKAGKEQYEFAENGWLLYLGKEDTISQETFQHTDKDLDKQGNWQTQDLYRNNRHYLRKRINTYYDSPK